jgi:hypothetical protein
MGCARSYDRKQMREIDSGYALVDGLFTAEECDSLIALLSKPMASRSRAGVRHLMGLPEIALFATDRRLMDLAGELLQAKAIPFRATLFDKSAQSNWLIPWHQDTSLPLAAPSLHPAGVHGLQNRGSAMRMHRHGLVSNHRTSGAHRRLDSR